MRYGLYGNDTPPSDDVAGLTEDTGIDRSLHAAAATACQAMAGASASTIERMVAELPPELQPIVMAKLSVRGRGGRHPAADPRSVDPNMDEKKVWYMNVA